MSENERIVCEFLRKIAPSREWEYLGEVEHCWIGELCDELNEQLKAENAKLRELLSSYWKAVHCPVTPTVPRDYLAEMRELGIGVDA